jgi:hypothetical protein
VAGFAVRSGSACPSNSFLGTASAKPAKLVTVKQDKVTLGVPKGYKVAVGERCISTKGAGSQLDVIRTNTSRDDFDKEQQASPSKVPYIE